MLIQLVLDLQESSYGQYGLWSAEKLSPGIGDVQSTSSCTLSREDSDTSCASVQTSVGEIQGLDTRIPLGCIYTVEEQLDDEESEGEECEEDEHPVFDPYLFMKHLPPLEDVVNSNRGPVLPPKEPGCTKMTLVLDLDETLVHSSLDGGGDPDFTFEVAFNGHIHKVNVQQRPYLAQFLMSAAERYEVVVFTASQQIYAEQLLDVLDPEGVLIQHRLFRDDCILVDGNYLKDLSALGRDLQRTVIVDNSPHAFGFQVANGIPIESWYDDAEDQELLGLLPFLEKLSREDDVRHTIMHTFKMHELIAASGKDACNE